MCILERERVETEGERGRERALRGEREHTVSLGFRERAAC